LKLKHDDPLSSFGFNVSFCHYAEAWAARHNPNVLLVFYEDLKDDADAQVKRCRLTLSNPR
jgi:hypothetical protein